VRAQAKSGIGPIRDDRTGGDGEREKIRARLHHAIREDLLPFVRPVAVGVAVQPGTEQPRGAGRNGDGGRPSDSQQRSERHAVFVILSGRIVARPVQRRGGIRLGVPQGSQDRAKRLVPGPVGGQRGAVHIGGVPEIPCAGVVVQIDHRCVGRVQPVVARIATDRRRGDDCVRHVAVDHAVVHAGDGHGLRRVPIRRGERDAGRRDGAFARVAGRQADRHVGRGLAGEDDRERVRAAAFGRRQAAGRIDRNPGRVVVRDLDRHGQDGDTLVLRVAAGGAVADRARMRAFGHCVIHRSDRNRLGHVPVGRRERQVGRADTQLTVGRDRDNHVGGGRRVERHRVGVSGAAFRHLHRAAAFHNSHFRHVVNGNRKDLFEPQPTLVRAPYADAVR